MTIQDGDGEDIVSVVGEIRLKKMNKDYIFSEWQPNLVLLIMWEFTYVALIFYVSKIEALFITLVTLLFGWSFSFSKRKIPK